MESRSVAGVVITQDHFGNLITNIDGALIERFRLPLVHAGNHSFPLLRTYGETRPGEYLALVNSFGVIEIARAEGSAPPRAWGSAAAPRSSCATGPISPENPPPAGARTRLAGAAPGPCSRRLRRASRG